MKVNGSNPRNWFPFQVERGTILFRNNHVELTHGFGDLGTSSSDLRVGALTAFESFSDRRLLDVTLDNNHITVTPVTPNTPEQAVILENVDGAVLEDNVVTGSAGTGFLLEGVNGAEIEDNNLCGLIVSDPDGANIILKDTINTEVEDNAGQVVKQDPFDPSNEIEDGEECDVDDDEEDGDGDDD